MIKNYLLKVLVILCLIVSCGGKDNQKSSGANDEINYSYDLYLGKWYGVFQSGANYGQINKSNYIFISKAGDLYQIEYKDDGGFKHSGYLKEFSDDFDKMLKGTIDELGEVRIALFGPLYDVKDAKIVLVLMGVPEEIDVGPFKRLLLESDE